jgi:TP901 family phage tail tape measure protein
MREVTDAVDQGKEKADGLGESLKTVSAIDLYAISESMGNLKNMLSDVSAPGIAFNSSMKEMQSITMMTDSEVNKLGKSARKLAKEFGTDASEMVGSYTGIISRLGPAIADSDEAMAIMGRDVSVLSKLMGNDAAGSMDALTTAMLQFGVDLSHPIEAANEMTRMMNVMAAAGNEGASEVGDTAEALKVAGVQALNANVSFEQTNAALQALAQGGLYGSEAGMKLRNVLSKLSGEDLLPQEAAEKLKALGVDYDIVSDKSLSFTDRLRELKKAQGDATVMAQVFGIQNEAAAQILLNSLDAQDDLTKKITGTNAAFDSANIVMSSYEERMARMKAWFTDLGIGIFGATQYILPFVTGLSGAVTVMANLANARRGIVLLMTTLKGMPVVGGIVSGAFKMMSIGARVLGVAIMNIPIIGWIAAVIAGLIALGAYFWNTSAEFRSVLTGIWEAVKSVFTRIGSFISEVAEGIWHLLKGVFNPENWFDDSYRFSDGIDKITEAARKYGESVGSSFAEGRAKGLESFYTDHPEKRPVAQAGTATNEKITGLDKSVSPVITPKPLPTNNDKNKNAGLSGSGGTGGVKNITQHIEIKNYFNVDGSTNTDSIAERVIRAITDKLRDSTTIAFG